jgi:DHA2 family methylenomycin A resistance protein-like MFS transporter
VVFVLSLFFQERLGQSAVVAGLMFAPMTLVVAGSNVASARTAARFGPRVPIVAGQLVCAVGLFALLGVGTGTDRLLVAVLLVPIGLGLGFAVPSLTAALLEDIDADRAGMAGGILNSIRQTGGALAVAVFGSLVGHRTSFAAGMHNSLLIALAMLALGIAAALTLPRHRAHLSQ